MIKPKKILLNLQVVAVATTKDIQKRETRRLFKVQLIDKDDNDPSIKNCDLVSVNDPSTVRIKKSLPQGTEITRINACDADGEPNNAIYYYMTCGDEKKFKVDQLTGVVRNLKKLDKRDKTSYKICVKVSPYANRTFSISNVRKTVMKPDEISLIVKLDDIDEFGPEFGESKKFTAALNAASLPGTEILKLTASDKDGVLSAEFQIEEVEFDSRTLKGAIAIDAKNGKLSTTLPNYYEYIGRKFQVRVKVADIRGRGDKALVMVNINEFQKFI